MPAAPTTLLGEKFLSPLEIYCGVPIEMDDKTVPDMSGGEYTAAAAGERVKGIVGDIVTEWHRMTRQGVRKVQYRPLLFSPTVADGKRVVQCLRRDWNYVLNRCPTVIPRVGVIVQGR